MLRTLFFRLHVGRYWAGDGSYNGCDIRECRVDFENPDLSMLIDMVLREGYAENMSKFSWSHPEVVQEHRKDLSCDNDVEEMIRCLPSFEITDLYVVRSNEPYLDDVIIGENEEEEEPESYGELLDFYRDDYASDDSDDDGDKPDFYVGQSFVTKERCKEAIEKYAIREKVNICFERSERNKVAARCVKKDLCDWRIYASINSRSEHMVVRSYKGTHKCYVTGTVKLYSAPKIAADFLNEFRTNRDLSAEQIMQRLFLNGLRIPKTKCQSARQIMMHIIDDEYVEQFTRIYDYAEELRTSNPCSTIVLGKKERVFEKFYTCFTSQRTGWLCACRRIIHLDGTFLKGRMKGQLLTVVGRDPNDSMFIIAWAIVPVENKVYWEWFMTLLKEDLNLEFGKAKAIIEKRKRSLRWCQTQRCRKGMYEVDHGRNKYRVCVRGTFSCACRSYDVSGIPCCHIIAAMLEEYGHTKLPETIVSDWYLTEKWKMCYNFLLIPVNGMDLWKRHSDIIVMPPPDRIMPGRPKNNDRICDPSEVLSDHAKVKVTCSNCRQIGRNKKKCLLEPVPKPPNLPPGRPTKKRVDYKK